MLEISDNCYLVETFNINNITDWKSIDVAKHSVIIDDNPGVAYLRFPGFVCDDKRLVDGYYDLIYSDIERVFTPPRGNISSKCKLMIVGIKPGTFKVKPTNSECSWLLGPSSNILHKMLMRVNTYPYFSNVFHDSSADEVNGDITQIQREIYYMHEICNTIKIIFLGKYEVYDRLINGICKKLKISAIKVWHPSYLCRSYTDSKFDFWTNDINVFVNGV